MRAERPVAADSHTHATHAVPLSLPGTRQPEARTHGYVNHRMGTLTITLTGQEPPLPLRPPHSPGVGTLCHRLTFQGLL